MPCITFTNVSGIFIRIEIRLEYSLVIDRLHEVSSRVIYIAIVLWTFVELVSQLGLTHLLSHFSNTEVIECIFQSTRQWPVLWIVFIGYIVRDITILLIRTNTTIFINISCSYTSLQCLFCIKITNTFQISIHNYRHRVVTNHHVCFATPEVPHRQTSVLFEECDERLHHIVYTGRLCICKQRMSRTECIPQREGAIICPAVGLMYLLVRSIVFAIHIAIDCRSNHAMIQSCIEIHTVVGIATHHFDGRQLLVPCILRLSQIFVEVIMRSFSSQVILCTFHAYTRNSGCNHHLVALFCIKVETSDVWCTNLFTSQLDISIGNFHLLERTGETSGKVYLLPTCPTFREAITTDIARVDNLNLRIHREIPVHGLFQIQDNHTFCFREGISLHTASRSSCQFYIDVIVLQLYTVIASRSFFVIMRKQRVNAQSALWVFLVRQSYRHKDKVVQVARTSTRQVGMTETGNRTIRIEVTWDTVPTRETVIRTKLHHTERRLCSRIRISCKIGSDKRIDRLRIVNRSLSRLIRHTGTHAQCYQQGWNKRYFHMKLRLIYIFNWQI